MPGDMNHMYYDSKVTIIAPDGEIIETNFIFKPEEIYTIDGWYTCEQTDGEWYLHNGKTLFTWDRFDNNLGKLYYSSKFGFCTKEQAEHFIRLKAFY